MIQFIYNGFSGLFTLILIYGGMVNIERAPIASLLFIIVAILNVWYNIKKSE